MKLRRIMIAAPKSGSGKTMFICGLLQAFKNMGQQVVSYKCGPDYIDPMFHRQVIGIPSKNLDTFFTEKEEVRELFLKGRREEELAVIEGVMGLFDGLGGIWEEGSSYHLAKVTKTPIILVVDAKGMGRSVIPLIAGFLQYDKEHLIQGIVLNRMSKSYYEVISPVLEEELGISVLGYLSEYKEYHIESRHLGLVMPLERENIKEELQEFSKKLSATVSLEKILKIAEEAENLTVRITKKFQTEIKEEEQPVIAVAKDEAFCFYYEDNLDLLRQYGARLKYFSPLQDEKLPEGCCGILLGGGYPELYAARLSANIRMRSAIRAAVTKGMPIVAECGGFMYLHAALTDSAKRTYTMAGVFSGTCQDTGKLVRFGYIELEDKKGYFLPRGGKIRGHEFHYYDSTENGCDCQAIKYASGKQYSCVIAGERHWLGFPHLYYPSNPAFAESFVKKANAYKMEKKFQT